MAAQKRYMRRYATLPILQQKREAKCAFVYLLLRLITEKKFRNAALHAFQESH